MQVLQKKNWFRGGRKDRLASVGIIEIEREPGIDKLGWHKKFDTGIERNISFKKYGLFTSLEGRLLSIY